jgi:X-Pro dipeptidyl-peptidase
VVDWLNGRAVGYGADGAPVRASWASGAVGMIGKSWDGSIANGVAATGVAGLCQTSDWHTVKDGNNKTTYEPGDVRCFPAR